MTYPKTLAANATCDIPPSARRVSSIKLSNTGSGTVYFGDIPGPSLLVTEVDVVNGNTYVTLPSAGAGLGIEPGMTAVDSDSAMALDARVTSVDGATVHVDLANDGANVTTTVEFGYVAISATNGHPLAPGETLLLDAGHYSLQHGLRIKADAAGSTLSITTKLA